MSNSNHDPKNKECLINKSTNGRAYNASTCTCPEQKEEWNGPKSGYWIEFLKEHSLSESVHEIMTQIALAEERGRRETITEFVEWANKYPIFSPACGHTGDEEKGYQKGITAGEKLFQTNLLAFADSLKSNLTQKS